MSRILDPVHRDYSQETSLSRHYEDTLRVMLTRVWERKILVVATIAGALVIGIAALLETPAQYTAQAYVRGGFGAGDAVTADPNSNVGGAVVALDALLLVETRSRLFQSQQLARRVVERVGLERVDPQLRKGLFSSLLSKLHSEATPPGYQEEVVAAQLLRGLSVRTEPRVYLITVQYTAGAPEFAALIVNTFVTEFLRTSSLQTLSHQRDSARSALLQDLATLGERHPKVIESKMRLEAADNLLTSEVSKTTEEIERTASGNVTFAQVTSIPSGPKPPIFIGVALAFGLVSGITLAAIRGRRTSKDIRAPRAELTI